MSGHGPAVLALHGAMGGYDQSAILAQALVPDGHRVIAVSRPGYLGTPPAVGTTPEGQADALAALLDALGLADAAVVAVSGGCPVLVVHGTADPLVPAEDARRFAAALPAAELLEIAGGGHMVLFTHRTGIREGVAAFLATAAG